MRGSRIYMYVIIFSVASLWYRTAIFVLGDFGNNIFSIQNPVVRKVMLHCSPAVAIEWLNHCCWNSETIQGSLTKLVLRKLKLVILTAIHWCRYVYTYVSVYQISKLKSINHRKSSEHKSNRCITICSHGLWLWGCILNNNWIVVCLNN